MARYFQIEVDGSGGEFVMAQMTKEQFDFWSNEKDKYYDDEENIYEEIFDQDEEDPLHLAHAWYEFDDIIHKCGPFMQDSRVTITEVDSDDYMAKHIADVAEYDCSDIMDEEVDAFSSIKWGEDDEVYASNIPGVRFVFFGVSLEKGQFFRGIVEDEGDFDPKKLQFTVEDIDGEYILQNVEYGDQEVDMELDTRGKALDYHFVRGTGVHATGEEELPQK